MSGHRKFTPKDWRKVENIKAEMRLALNAEVSKFDAPDRPD